MQEKIKITRKELDDLYDIEESKDIPEKVEDKNFTFEEYTEQYDKKEVEENES